MATPDRVSYWNKTRQPHVRHAWRCGSSSATSSTCSWTQLNNIVILGFPLGFYMAAQGSLIAFVVMLFWFARKQNAIDEEHGVAED